MLSLIKNSVKIIILCLIYTAQLQATHDFNKPKKCTATSKSITFKKFLSRNTISNEFRAIYEDKYLKNQLSQDLFDKELSQYLTPEKIQELLPGLYTLADNLCKKILQTQQYSLKIKLGFDDAGKKIGYNAQVKDILACTGISKYIAAYPTENLPLHPKNYSFCIQLGYELLLNSSNISLEKTIGHEIGHIKHEHTLKKRFYYQFTLVSGMLVSFFFGYYFFPENFCMPVSITLSMVFGIIFLYLFEEKISNYISRYHELEADKTGVEALLSNGEILRNNFDILEIIEFIQHEEAHHESIFDCKHTNTTHPLPETRFQAISTFAKKKIKAKNSK